MNANRTPKEAPPLQAEKSEFLFPLERSEKIRHYNSIHIQFEFLEAAVLLPIE